VHAYLSSGGWADPAFVAGLRRERPQDPARWEAKVAAMADEIADPLALPPFITEYRDGDLSLRDGNHRHEALRRRGVTDAAPHLISTRPVTLSAAEALNPAASRRRARRRPLDRRRIPARRRRRRG
jgi:hypothetical protein